MNPLGTRAAIAMLEPAGIGVQRAGGRRTPSGRVAALLWVAASIGLASPAWAARLQDADLRQAIEGAWCDSDDGGRTCHGFDVLANGTSTSCGVFPGTTTPFTAASRYTVQGNQVCHDVTRSSDPTIMKPGDRICLNVIAVDDRRFRFQYVDWPEATTIYRVPRARVVCPADPR